LTVAKDNFIDEALAEHYSDLLYRVQLRAGKEAYVYLLFEHKSAPASRVALDLLRYLVRIWRKMTCDARLCEHYRKESGLWRVVQKNGCNKG
jgi:predicted transposase YdaD